MSGAADREAAGGAGQPLHIVVINDFASVTGGTANVAIAEAAGLARRGHRVTMVAGHGEPAPQLVEAGVKLRISGQHTTLSHPNRRQAAAQGIWNREAAALVREVTATADGGLSVVHLHGFDKVLSVSVARAAVDSGLPMVATLHDYSTACPNGGFYNYQRDHICTLAPLSMRCVATNCDARAYSHKLWRVARSAVQRGPGVVPSGVRAFIAPSALTAEIMRPFLPKEAPLHVLPNAITIDRMPAVDPAANQAFTFVGRLDHDKGPVMFALAARKSGVPAVFVGSGEETEAIRRAYPDAQLTGWLDPEGVQTSLRGARAVVNCSLWYETQGLVPLEAAAHGVPAIVSDITAARDAVADGVSGLWFRGGDVDDLADKLALLARDHSLATRFGSAAYERFWSEARDLSTHLDRLEQIYRAALA